MVKCKKACPTNFPSVNLRNTKITSLRKMTMPEVEKSESEEKKQTQAQAQTKPAFKIDIILS